MGTPFERTCRLSQNPRALQCSYELQRKLQAGYMGRNAKDTIRGAPKKEGNRTSPPPYPGIGRHRFWWKPFIGRGRESKPSVAVTRRVFAKGRGYQHQSMCKCAQPQETSIEIRNNQVDVFYAQKSPIGMASPRLHQVEPNRWLGGREIRCTIWRWDQRWFDVGASVEIKPVYSERQAAKSQLAPFGAFPQRPPDCRVSEMTSSVTTRKLANSRQGAESQLETAPVVMYTGCQE
jgi:hypothetical protein